MRIEKRVDEKRITSITVKINLKTQKTRYITEKRKKERSQNEKKKKKKYPGNVNLDRHEKRKKRN